MSNSLLAHLQHRSWKYVLYTLCCLALFCFLPAPKVFALSESESAITFRGNQQTLSLAPLAIHMQTVAPLGEEEAKKILQSSLQDIANIVPSTSAAQLLVHVQKDQEATKVKISSPTYPLITKSFILPADANALRRSILGYAQYMGVQNLQNDTSFSGITWYVHTYAPTAANDPQALNVQGSFWKPARVLKSTGEKATVPYDASTLLTFSFNNASQENVYVYLLNITETGQILPILAPSEQKNTQNTLLYGKEHVVNNIFLELGAKVESVRLIISRVPLSFSLWQQENFHSPKTNFMHATQTPKADAWTSWEINFVKK